MVRTLPCHGRGHGFESRPLRFHMFTVYIIQSLKDSSYYVGQTDNLEKRIKRHNLGKCNYTKKKIPWKLVYKEEFSTRAEAIKREKEIKNKKRKSYIKWLIKNKR